MPVISSLSKARRVCPRMFPAMPMARENADIDGPSGASNTPTMS